MNLSHILKSEIGLCEGNYFRILLMIVTETELGFSQVWTRVSHYSNKYLNNSIDKEERFFFFFFGSWFQSMVRCSWWFSFGPVARRQIIVGT